MSPPEGLVPSIPFASKGTRTALEDAAICLVRRQGWTATTVEQVCRTAGVTKGAFFHHFDSKEALGVAAARRWGEVTSALFSSAGYHGLADPLARIYAYLDFRGQLAEGPLEAVTCFAGTMVQETFATCEPLRAACGQTIDAHVALLTPDFQEAIERYPPREPATAAGLALHTQVVLQGAFVLAKAKGDSAPVRDALAHLKRYLGLLFGHPAPAPNDEEKQSP
jgi:TetR/AcrR family transcriptional repressor of nem operon